MLREGDPVYIDVLDRLGRDYDGTITKWKTITREISTDIVCVDNEALLIHLRRWVISWKSWRINFFRLLAYVLNRNERQRQAEGVEIARAESITFRRTRQEVDGSFIEAYHKWKSGQITATEAMRLIGMKSLLFIDV